MFQIQIQLDTTELLHDDLGDLIKTNKQAEGGAEGAQNLTYPAAVYPAENYTPDYEPRHQGKSNTSCRTPRFAS